jgi:uncharacterized membrane protein
VKDLKEGEVIEYEVFFGCDNGIFYCLNAKDLSLNWQYQTGDRILSSPAICNINYDDDLEVIVGSNDGIVYCFEGDPRELDRDGIPNPKDDGIEDGGGEVGTYDILWKFDTNEIMSSSGQIGISSPVVGDLDCDGQLEVLIGDDCGTLYCINAGGKCVPGQLDWPKFRGDLNNTGFYKPLYSTHYGVLVDRGLQNIEGQWGPEKLQKVAKPGQTISYNITVQNTGILHNLTSVDTFWISLEQSVYKFDNLIEDHEWLTPILTGEDLKWDNPKGGDGKLRPFVILKSREMTNLTLYVTAPWTSELSEFCRVSVIAQSANGTFARDSILTETLLDISLDFQMEILKEPVQDKDSDYYGLKIIKINPSDKATIELKVKNTGNINDSYDLMLSSILSDWEVYFEDSNSPIHQNALQLDAPLMEKQFPDDFSNSEEIISFVIEAPADAQLNEILTLKVTATSKYSLETSYIENISKVDYLVIEVNPRPDLELKCQNPRKYVTPGGEVAFEVQVLNHGNSNIKVKIEHSQHDIGWGIKFLNYLHEPFFSEDVLLDILKDGEGSVLVVISSPMNATAGCSQNIVIKGTTQSDAAIVSSDSVVLTAIISQEFDINAIVSPEVIETEPGNVITYEIDVSNNGNGHDYVIMNLFELKINWISIFYFNSDERHFGNLLYNNSLVFTLQIEIPENEIAGEYISGINVTSLGGSEFVEFKTIVKKVYNLSVYGVIFSKTTSEKTLNNTIKPYPGVSLGSKVNYLFEIKNTGNHPDWIVVNFNPMKQINNGGIGDLIIGEWFEFEKLNWTGYIVGLANTDSYFTNLEELDFSQNLDVSHKSAPYSYVNSNTSVQNMQFRLGVGQTVWLKTQLTVPRDLQEVYPNLHPNKDDPWYFRLDVFSSDTEGKLQEKDLSDNVVSIVNIIRLPDLEIVNNKIYHPDKIQSGKIVTISAKIRNNGDIQAQDVVVTFNVNNKVVRTNTISILAIGQTRLVPFNWEAGNGEQELIIKVDPYNGIVEKDENNNEARTTINVESGGFLGLSDQSCVTIAWFFILIILIVISVLLKKRLKRNREKKKEE